MTYYIDLKTKNIQDFKRKLKDTILLPSQKILKDKFEEKFACIEKHGLRSLFDIQETLKTKVKVQEFSDKSSLSVDYLTVLRREVNSYHPQPRNLKDFPCINPEIIKKLMQVGIKTTVQLYHIVVNKDKQNELCNELNVSHKDSVLLAKLTDFSRMRYINQTFATLLINSKYDTIDKIKNANHKELHAHLTKLNDDKNYFKGKIALTDMELFIRDAKYINSAIEF